MLPAKIPATPAEPATNFQARTAALPRIKLLRHNYSIDHSDPQAGERRMAEALGVADRDAMDGMLRQLVRASISGQKPDKVNLAFMISMIEGIAPRDSIEAMLVAQMASIHVAAMRCACQLAITGDIEQQDSISRALARLTRTFAAQVEALNRHRNHGGPAITVQNLSVQDGGKAIVGNVTQHAIAAQPSPALAPPEAPMTSPFDIGTREHEPIDAAMATQR